MVAEKQTPLAVVGNGRCMSEHVENRARILAPKTHEQARHQRKMKGHMKLVAVPEIRPDVGGPLIGLGQEDSPLILLVDALPHLPQIGMSLRKVFTDRALA